MLGPAPTRSAFGLPPSPHFWSSTSPPVAVSAPAPLQAAPAPPPGAPRTPGSDHLTPGTYSGPVHFRGAPSREIEELQANLRRFAGKWIWGRPLAKGSGRLSIDRGSEGAGAPPVAERGAEPPAGRGGQGSAREQTELPRCAVVSPGSSQLIAAHVYGPGACQSWIAYDIGNRAPTEWC